MTVVHWLIYLGGAVVLLFVFLTWEHKKTGRSIQQVIRSWPHADTLLLSGVLLSAWTVIFYEGCLVFMQTSSYEPFTKAMAPVFTFLNWMVLTGAGLSIGRRMTTKVDVIDAHARTGQTAEFSTPESRP